MKRSIAGLTSVLLLFAPSLGADDGAASIAAGGIVMRHEPRVTMAKEVLRISPSKVIVDYDFRNDTDADVVTEVAFPIPDYSLAEEDYLPSQQGFDDFKLWVDQKPLKYTIEAKAIVKDRDFGPMLRSMGVDVASFGGSVDNGSQPQIRRLSPAQRSRLVRAGLIDKEYGEPEWKVRKKYYWSQTFPAHRLVHIRHEYTPVLGNTNSVSYGLDAIRRGLHQDESAKELESLCLEPKLRDALGKMSDSITKRTHDNIGTPWPTYVDFILTTANTWKTPIEDFTLIVDRPPATKKQHTLTSFCWAGPVTHPSADEFVVHTTNLIPKNELRIGFINIPDTP